MLSCSRYFSLPVPPLRGLSKVHFLCFILETCKFVYIIAMVKFYCVYFVPDIIHSTWHRFNSFNSPCGGLYHNSVNLRGTDCKTHHYFVNWALEYHLYFYEWGFWDSEKFSRLVLVTVEPACNLAGWCQSSCSRWPWGRLAHPVRIPHLCCFCIAEMSHQSKSQRVYEETG